MADFTTVMTSVADVDDSLVIAYEKSFLLALAEQGSVEQFVTLKRDIGAKSIELSKFAQLALVTSELTDKEDPASEALVDSKVTLTPGEYGKVVTTTKLANLQTGGKADLGASRVVGINAGRSQTKLAMLAADSSSNVYTPGGTAVGSLVAGDVITAGDVGYLYNRLSRANAIGISGDEFVLIMHEDVLHDLREATGTGSWLDVTKYARPDSIYKNEVGMFKGFRIIKNNLCTLTADAGAAAVDVYNTYAIGFNALGKAVSDDVKMKITGPFDKLQRFLNFGWYGVLKYGIVEQDALWVYRSASSVGANT